MSVMKTNLPTETGPFWWREKDGDEWELWHITEVTNPPGFIAGRGFNHGRVEKFGGQWAKCHRPDEGQEAEIVFDQHNRVRHLGSIMDYAKLIGVTVSQLRRSGYTCEPVTIHRRNKE